jgi:hypothetical protein
MILGVVTHNTSIILHHFDRQETHQVQTPILQYKVLRLPRKQDLEYMTKKTIQSTFHNKCQYILFVSTICTTVTDNAQTWLTKRVLDEHIKTQRSGEGYSGLLQKHTFRMRAKTSRVGLLSFDTALYSEVQTSYGEDQRRRTTFKWKFKWKMLVSGRVQRCTAALLWGRRPNTRLR